MNMKPFITVVAAISTSAFAERPHLVGTIVNRAGGEIVLMSDPCWTDDTQRFAYIKDDGGRISLTGCWTFIKPNIYVFWNNGAVFQYEFGVLNMTEEYREYLNRNYPQEVKP